jgi:hypothetical protein
MEEVQICPLCQKNLAILLLGQEGVYFGILSRKRANF